MDYNHDPVFEQAPIIHKFQVVEGGEDVPQCALECRPKDKINPKLCLYQFFAMVDDNFSTVAFGKNETCFHVAFKPDDWEQVKVQYPTGTILRLEMYPIGPEVSSGDGHENETSGSYAGHGTSVSEYGSTHSAALVTESPPAQEVDIEGLKSLINEIVDEMTEPISRKMDENKLMIEEIQVNQNERYQTLPNMIKQEMEHHRLENEGAAFPADNQEEACKCVIS